MITQLTIENYKSIQALTLDVGRVNVLIGENGCGKSNILEAIIMVSAASAATEENELDNEFLKNRGIRITEPKLMRSAFEDKTFNNDIKINFKLKELNISRLYILKNDNLAYSKWTFYEEEDNLISLKIDEIITRLKLKNATDYTSKESEEKIRQFIKEFWGNPIVQECHRKVGFIKSSGIRDFLIYSPENTALRNLEKEAQIEPLGINGEGLLKLLSVIQHESPEQLSDIQESLALFDWYDSLIIPNELSPLERKLTIQDRYLAVPFDQRSANEGFLFVLFYITLMVSNYTPKIFAIDNIDTSLNPKLCTKLIKVLSDLAKKYDKQFFVTSHNPAILDGIDLGDDEQRLFVVSRNKQGHTRCKRIELKDKPKSAVRERLEKLFEDDKTYTKAQILELFDNSPEDLKLSYALLRGYLGGLPKNF